MVYWMWPIQGHKLAEKCGFSLSYPGFSVSIGGFELKCLYVGYLVKVQNISMTPEFDLIFESPLFLCYHTPAN